MCVWRNTNHVKQGPFCLESAQFEPPHDKTNKESVCPAKTPISLGIRPVWSEHSLCAQWVAKDPSFLHADSEDSDKTGLIWVFAGRTCHFLGFVTRWLIYEITHTYKWMFRLLMILVFFIIFFQSFGINLHFQYSLNLIIHTCKRECNEP